MRCQECDIIITRDDPILAICEDCFRYNKGGAWFEQS